MESFVPQEPSWEIRSRRSSSKQSCWFIIVPGAISMIPNFNRPIEVSDSSEQIWKSFFSEFKSLGHSVEELLIAVPEYLLKSGNEGAFSNTKWGIKVRSYGLIVHIHKFIVLVSLSSIGKVLFGVLNQHLISIFNRCGFNEYHVRRSGILEGGGVI